MKKRLIKMALSVLMMICVSACSGNAETVDENHDSSAIISESEDIEAESTEETILSEEFCESNSWSYTRLGHISDKDEAGMTELLSNGDVTITISMG